MKKRILWVLLLFLVGISFVKAANHTPEELAVVINNGDITKEYIKEAKSGDCELSIHASATYDSVLVTYNYRCLKTVEVEIGDKIEKNKELDKAGTGSVTFTVSSDGKQLEIHKEMTKQQVEEDPYAPEMVKLMPFWGVEMSSQYKQIKGYIDDNHDGKKLKALREIFDKCYYDEMGVCYSPIISEISTVYMGMIKLDDTAGEYALKTLKNEQRDIDTSKRNKILILVAAGILVLLLLCKSLAPNPAKKEKFVWSIENQNIKK